MSKIKVLLNVVEGMRSLADSMAELADVIATCEDESTSSGDRATQAAPVAPHDVRSVPNESQQGATTKPVQEAAQPQSQPTTTLPQSSQPEDDEPKFDLVTLRAAVAQYSTPENRPKIKEILTHFGVKKLTELKEEQYLPLFNEVFKACEK